MDIAEKIITDSLMQQTFGEFEETLRNAAKLKQILPDETKQSTTAVIMQLLGKKEKKPVTYDEEMDFIDDGAEEVVVPPRASTHRRGNPEQHVQELGPISTDRYDRMECGTVIGSGKTGKNKKKKKKRPMTELERQLAEERKKEREQINKTGDEEEQIRQNNHTENIRPDERILGPGSGPMFTSLTPLAIGSDLLQRNMLTPANYALITQQQQLQQLQQQQQRPPLQPPLQLAYQPPLQPAYDFNPELLNQRKEEKPAAIEMKPVQQLQQRKGKKKKEKGLENEYTVAENEFNNTQRSLSDILLELGETVSVEPKGAGAKKGNKKNKGVTAENTKEQNNKNKKKNQPSSSNSSNNNNNNNKMEQNMISEEENVTTTAIAATAAPVQTKRSSSGVNGGPWEDAEEEFMSADEDLKTPPTEFVDARTTATANSTVSPQQGTQGILHDPSNYRDDKEVELLAKQLKEQEDEFITVGGGKNNNKKNKAQQQRNSAVEERRNSPPKNAEQQNGRRYSVEKNASSSQQQHNKSQNNRPVPQQSTNLGELLEVSKKETHKNVKHHGGHNYQRRSAKQEEEIVGFVDALESSSPINVNTNPPTSGFSYADAAKKSSSGENSPQNEMRSPTARTPAETSAPAPTSAAAQESSAVQPSSPPNVQLPPGISPQNAVESEVSFGYVDPSAPADNYHGEGPSSGPVGGSSQDPQDNDFVLKFGSRVVKFAKGLAEDPKEVEESPLRTALINILKDEWDFFNSGDEPEVYEETTPTSSPPPKNQ
ncbi:unnamed protein product [Caenorhabditis angaria]|uniref:Uncharacterized protein n=1 Tax=Caenorhabditis angaria TaxID=860376 RepID=A0A9P1IGZ5_9PELO|nr:unnamed protein product [Caenorhabditis angaria]